MKAEIGGDTGERGELKWMEEGDVVEVVTHGEEKIELLVTGMEGEGEDSFLLEQPLNKRERQK